MIKTISLIGAGNVATHLAPAFRKSSVQIDTIWSRNFLHAQSICGDNLSKPTSEWRDLPTDNDMYLICVSDDAILPVLKKLKRWLSPNSLVVHTSGSVPSDLIAEHFMHFGVLYPLQSFTINRAVDISEVPFLVTAGDAETEQKLVDLANGLSNKVQVITDRQRLVLHIAAVFSNNFTNYMYHVAAGLMEENGLDFDLLRPLIKETAEKVLSGHPTTMQTGPAKRQDKKTMKKHLDYLNDRSELFRLYRLVSRSIHGKGKLV